jgi:hypothetical protein
MRLGNWWMDNGWDWSANKYAHRKTNPPRATSSPVRTNSLHIRNEFSCADINWEDPDLICDHCRKRIESAYAEDKAQSPTL